MTNIIWLNKVGAWKDGMVLFEGTLKPSSPICCQGQGHIPVQSDVGQFGHGLTSPTSVEFQVIHSPYHRICSRKTYASSGHFEEAEHCGGGWEIAPAENNNSDVNSRGTTSMDWI